MTYTRSTNLGEIKISDLVIARIILDAMSAPDMKGIIWPATVHGRQLGRRTRSLDSEFASNIECSYSEEEGSVLEFSVIVKFGISIRKTTRELSDRIHDDIEYVSGISTDLITINIAGVKSRNTAKRNIKAVYRYGTD